MVEFLHTAGNASDKRFAIVVARFNAEITDALLDGALHALGAAGVADGAIEVARVPGAFELPLTCQALAATGRFDAVLALGCVIRGDTPHFDYVCSEAARGCMRVGLDAALPVIFGVLTTDTLDQARRRADRAVLAGSDVGTAGRDAKESPRSNKGVEAAEAALSMTSLLASIR